jgi:hypothetical protein
MAVVIPLKLNGSNLQEMTPAEIVAVQLQAVYQYGTDPSVDLTQVASGGNLGAISDTRFVSGTAVTSVSAYPSEASTGEPVTTAVSYARLTTASENTTERADTDLRAFPVYNNSGSIQAMSVTDMYDTFIKPAISLIIDGSDRPGTYRMHTATTLAGHTLISTTPIFTDTKANLAGMTAAEIGTTGTRQTDATTVTNFYLFRTNAGSSVSHPNPVFIRSDNDLQQMPAATFNSILYDLIRHAASEVTGHRVTYSLSTGTVRGSGMTDTRITSTAGTKSDRFVNANDYRSQEFPTGTASTQTTTSLRISKT